MKGKGTSSKWAAPSNSCLSTEFEGKAIALCLHTLIPWLWVYFPCCLSQCPLLTSALSYFSLPMWAEDQGVQGSSRPSVPNLDCWGVQPHGLSSDQPLSLSRMWPAIVGLPRVHHARQNPLLVYIHLECSLPLRWWLLKHFQIWTFP